MALRRVIQETRTDSLISRSGVLLSLIQMQAGLIQETLDEAIDDAFDDSDMEEAADAEVAAVLAEIGVDAIAGMAHAPSGALPQAGHAQAAGEDDEEDELAARLRMLKA